MKSPQSCSKDKTQGISSGSSNQWQFLKIKIQFIFWLMSVGGSRKLVSHISISRLAFNTAHNQRAWLTQKGPHSRILLIILYLSSYHHSMLFHKGLHITLVFDLLTRQTCVMYLTLTQVWSKTQQVPIRIASFFPSLFFLVLYGPTQNSTNCGQITDEWWQRWWVIMMADDSDDEWLWWLMMMNWNLVTRPTSNVRSWSWSASRSDIEFLAASPRSSV